MEASRAARAAAPQSAARALGKPRLTDFRGGQPRRKRLGTIAAVVALALGPFSSTRVPATPAERASPAVWYVIGISPFLDGPSRNDAFRNLVRFVIEDLPLNCSLQLLDAYHLRTLTRLDVPDLKAFQSGKTRATQFREPIQEARRFLATTHPKPEAAGLDFSAATRFPQFLDFVADNLLGPDHTTVVVVLGSPLYLDEKEPGFSMANGYFPSDGHLLAGRDKSVYGLKDRGRQLKDVTVHLGYFGDPWATDLHQERVIRFWRLFAGGQGARLGACSADLPTVFQAARVRTPPEEAGTRTAPIDPDQDKIEMLRISRDVGAVEWLTRDRPDNLAQQPPTATVGRMKIGIRWQGDLDLDLYARPQPGSERLYFEHTRSPEGYYYKDHRSSPDREYEFIEFQQPVDVWKAEAAVNFYEGAIPGGPVGEVRIEFDGRIYTGRFRLEAANGNRGREGGGQSPWWSRLDIPQILKLR